MIPGDDSSFDAPTLAQAEAAYAAGVRVWGGYFGSRDGLGLAVRWNRMSFWNVQQAGIQAIGFCSGWDDPEWIRATAAEWSILPCVDVEHGIRDEFDGGVWLPGFLPRAQCGLYGPMAVHYANGEPPGRGAAFNILAWYPDSDPRSTWFDAIELRPPGPCGWQWRGTHIEFGLNVDRGWYDDWFTGQGDDMADFADTTLGQKLDQLANVLIGGSDSRVDSPAIYDRLDDLASKVGAPAAVDPQALNDAVASALAAHPLTSTLSDEDRQAVATTVVQRLGQGFAQAAGS